MKNLKGNSPMLKPNLLLCSLSIAVSGALVGEFARADSSAVLDEIMVTARRKEEALQDVPVAVTAFDSKAILERGLRSEGDLQASTPGLMIRVTNSSNQLNYSLRGQTVDSFSNSQPSVLAYINEVQVGGVTASSFFDLESVQILKGPQGTLFGRNSTGGAVLYQTRKPEETLGGYLKVGAGRFSEETFEGAINVPLSETWAARLSGLKRERDGWQENVYSGEELATIDTENVRFSLSYSGDKASNHFVGYWGEHGGKTEGLRLRNAYRCLQTAGGVCIQSEPNPKTGTKVGDLLFATELYPEGAMLAPAGFPLGELVTDNPRLIELGQEYGFIGFRSFVDAARGLDFYDVMNDQSNDSDIEHRLFTNTTTYELSDNMTLKNVIGYNDVESFQATDPDGSPFMMLRMGDERSNGGYQYNTEQFSEELQLSGSALGDALQYIAGVYYYEEEFENDIPLKFIADYSTDPFGPAFTYHARIKNESKSVYAQATYALTDRANLTVGARQTWEEVCIQHYDDSAYFFAGLTAEFCQKKNRPSWLASVDYQVSDSGMVYIATRGSWRTGGFNVTSTNVTPAGLVPDSFKPEETWDVELGYKFSGTWGEVPTNLNIAVYTQTVEDPQRTIYLQITSQTGNVGEAEVKGLELDATFQLTDWLQIGGAYAYTDAEFTDPQGDVIGYTLDFGPYADAPKNTYSVFFRAEQDIAGVGVLSFRGDFYHADETYFSNLDDSIGPDTGLDSYELVNFHLGLEEIGGSKFSATAYLRNATDEQYERGGTPLAGVTATNATIIGEPRTYGLELSYRF